MKRSRRFTAGALLVPAVFLGYGCMTGGAALPDDDPHYAGELGCQDTSVDSPTDRACRADCIRDCGFNGSPNYPRAKKYCVCQGGAYIECRCPRPDWYIGDTFAPYCDPLTPEGDGMASNLNGLPCEREWDQCVGRDPVEGYTPRGCVCLNRRGTPDNPQLVWVCGSTEKWFAPEQ